MPCVTFRNRPVFNAEVLMAPRTTPLTAVRDCLLNTKVYPKVSGLERELHMVQLSATRCSCIAILWVSLVSFAAITLCVASQRIVLFIRSTQSGNVLDILSYIRNYPPNLEDVSSTEKNHARTHENSNSRADGGAFPNTKMEYKHPLCDIHHFSIY
jgi:hypothetical protein